MIFNWKGVRESFKKLEEDKNKLLERYVDNAASNIVEDLRSVTPVDTGLARDSWERGNVSTKDNKTEILIKNEVPYIEDLNAGSSKQAPPFFVEQVALNHGRPSGSIIRTRKS